MNENVLAQYPKEHLLEGTQIPVHVSILLKKLATRGKIEPLSFQKVGHESEHPKVTWLGHLIVPSGMRKC
jgi:hypothetical protein